MTSKDVENLNWKKMVLKVEKPMKNLLKNPMKTLQKHPQVQLVSSNRHLFFPANEVMGATADPLVTSDPQVGRFLQFLWIHGLMLHLINKLVYDYIEVSKYMKLNLNM